MSNDWFNTILLFEEKLYEHRNHSRSDQDVRRVETLRAVVSRLSVWASLLDVVFG